MSELPPWQREIVKAFPDIFFEGSNREEVLLRGGIECGEGWAVLICWLCSKGMEILTQARKSDPSSEIKSGIVKQKLGKLRWQGYCKLPEPFLSEWRKMIRIAESTSEEVCEYTGDPGQLVQFGGCWRTVSDEILAKWIHKYRFDMQVDNLDFL